MTRGTITSPFAIALDVSASSSGTVDSTLIAGTSIGFNLGGGSVFGLKNVTITTKGIGIQSNASNLTLDGTLVKRLDQPGTSGPAIEVLGVNTFSSSSNGNHFCNQNSAGPNKFSAAIVKDSATSGAFTGSFSQAAQVNMGQLDQCP